MNTIDAMLDKITMYRLILYYLFLLIGVAGIYSFLGVLPFSPLSLIFSTCFLLGICWGTNKLFSHVFRAPTNIESTYITACILTLIITPAKSIHDIIFLFFASLLSIASKYILAINKKHLFNPVAIAVTLTAWGFGGTASWWIGTASMLPFTLVGILIVRKIQRFDLIFYFFITAIMTVLMATILSAGNVVLTIKDTLFSSALFFFAFVMLTEPLTTPPTKKLQIIYGAFVGLLFVPQFHIRPLYTTPEIALVLGNVYSYFVSPKYKIIARVREKIQIAPGLVDFLIQYKKVAFIPGQYMEWTLPHKNPDSRGNRRYFTIASSPTEETLRLGIKFYQKSSSFKKALLTIDSNTPIVGAQLSGDFILPKDRKQKLVFIAGGIGITPFRSMIKYLLDIKEKRDIILFYANKTSDEIIYHDIFIKAFHEFRIKTIYTLTNREKIPTNWQGWVGRVSENMIQKEVPDYKERTFYLSGPHTLVVGFEEILQKMNIPAKQIKKDFFPGLK